MEEDIRIIRIKDRAYLTGVTHRGRKWLFDNIDDKRLEPRVSIDAELVSDIMNDIQMQGLKVEVK